MDFSQAGCFTSLGCFFICAKRELDKQPPPEMLPANVADRLWISLALLLLDATKPRADQAAFAQEMCWGPCF